MLRCNRGHLRVPVCNKLYSGKNRILVKNGLILVFFG
ncbi:hypothetical protein KSS87_021883 [Heliosperma pusillum]|nr:hypothetical protein KSS87_021883 [Heliosperma pusillum]